MNLAEEGIEDDGLIDRKRRRVQKDEEDDGVQICHKRRQVPARCLLVG